MGHHPVTLEARGRPDQEDDMSIAPSAETPGTETDEADAFE
jgi:hypothetical protein